VKDLGREGRCFRRCQEGFELDRKKNNNNNNNKVMLTSVIS
jgi:hypothetical protein